MSMSHVADSHCPAEDDIDQLQERVRALGAECERLRSENDRLRQTIDNVPALIFRKDCHNHILEINRTFAERMQVSAADWAGRSCDELFPPDIAKGYWEADQQVLIRGTACPPVLEYLQLPDGTRRVYETSKIPLYDDQGRICEILGLAIDIEDQLKATQALEASEQRFRELYEELSQGVAYQDDTGKILMANPAALEILGCTVDELRTASSLDKRWRAIRRDGSVYPGEEHPAMLALKTGKRVERQLMGVYNPRQQRYRWINISAVPLFREGEARPYQVFTSFEDLSVLIEAEEKLRLFKAAIETSRDLLFVLDPGYRYLLANQSYLHSCQRSEEELLGAHVRDIHGEEFFQRVRVYFERVLAGESHTHELVRDFPGKAQQVLLVSHAPIRNGQGEVVAVATSATNITELKERDRSLRTLLGNLPGMAYRCHNDHDWSMAFVSEGALALTGYSPEKLISGELPYESLIHPDDRELVREAVESGLQQRRHFEIEYRIQTADGETRWVWERGIGLGEGVEATLLEGFVTDVSARRALEERLHQNQRVDSLGRLAGGVAHDLNNLLSPILGYCEFLQEDLADRPDQQGYVNEVSRAANRAAQLTRQLLALGRRQTLQLVPEDVNTILKNCRELLASALREEITLELQLHDGELLCLVDRAQLEQVLVNLALNARDAMSGGGRVVIQSACITAEAGSLPGLESSGRFASLSVTDSGCGMSEEVLARLFEPFYSTKPRTAGCGLGLASAFGIIKQHNGHLWAESREGLGSAFHILLPLRDTAESREPESVSKTKLAKEQLSCCVLVVEDEEQVRALAVRFLTRMGYRVVAAMDGHDALRIVAERELRPGLMLSDVIMPGMNGRELYDQLQQRIPGLRVIFMSGYTDDVLEKRGGMPVGAHFLSKPFTYRSMEAKIQEALGEA